MTGYKYFAFISYSHHDIEWGKKVQRKLEGYRIPATLCSEHGWKRRPINPVFFAPTDIQPGILSDELKERLKASRHLIVICSPHSAKSEWVGQEIEYFHSLGRTANIHFFIVGGVPHSNDPEKECFNPIIEKLKCPEILGANIYEKIYRLPHLNRERAYVQLVTTLLGVEFDSIWHRHKRLLAQKTTAWAVGIAAVLASLGCVYQANRPVDVSLGFYETSVHNDNLPALKDAVVAIRFGDETKTDTVASIGSVAKFLNIPRHFLNRDVSVSVRCRNWQDVDTTMQLAKDVTVRMQRDPSVYGNVHFSLWRTSSGQFVAGGKVQVDGIEAVSGNDGVVNIFIPLDRQKTKYTVTSDLPLENNIIGMPCGRHDIIEVR